MRVRGQSGVQRWARELHLCENEACTCMCAQLGSGGGIQGSGGAPEGGGGALWLRDRAAHGFSCFII